MKLSLFKCVLVCLFLGSCSISEKGLLENKDWLFVDSLLLQYSTDSVMMRPQSTLHVFSEARNQVTDSVSSYKLRSKIAQCHYVLSDYDSALIICEQVVDFANREKANPHPAEIQKILSKMQADALNTRGFIFLQRGQWDSALSCIKESFNLFPLTAIAYNIAMTNYHIGDYASAIQYFRKALFNIDSLGEGESHYYQIYSGIARTYQELDNFELAEYYYEQAKIHSANATLYDQHDFENALANFFYRKKDYQKVLEHNRKSAQIAEKLEQPLLQAVPIINIGDAYIMLEQPDSARFYLDYAKELVGSLFQESRLYFPITSLYVVLALMENNLPEAERLLLQPYDTLSVNPQYIYNHDCRMHELYLRKKDFEKAYYYRVKAETYSDSIRNLKVQNNIAEIDMRYSQDTTVLRKDIQLALTESQVIQWKYTTGISIGLFVLALILVAGFVLYRRKISELHQIKQRSTITGLRMEIIRNRLSPHFMFNALNLVMPNLSKYKELENPFRLLIQLLRDNLVASEQIAVPLKQEIERVQNFLQLQELKQEGKMRTEWDIAPETPEDQLVPSMSIQIPVENVVKYAFPPDWIQIPLENAEKHASPPDYADACLQIGIKPQDNAISITIEDNGIGYHPDGQTDRKRGTGSGLKMLQRTIELLNANNSAKIKFKIENKNADSLPTQGTRVHIFIPYNYNFEL